MILFIGGVATNWVASDLQKDLEPYRRWVWLVFAIALIVTVVLAIRESHRTDSPPSGAATETADIVTASGDRSVSIGGNVKKSSIVTGDRNVANSRFGGDFVSGDKIIHMQPPANVVSDALHQLRAPVGDFVGREPEIDTLINALRQDSAACITGINGMGGIGKTELALFVAQHLSGDYPDAQFFINLQGADANPRPPEDVMANCIRAFRGPEAKLPEDFDQLSQIYRSELNGKRVLMLLDNARDSAQVRPLLPPAGSALLVTSRQAITLPGMTRLTLNPLTDEEAHALLLEIAPRTGPAAEQICRLCGYLPLAIRAAGSLLAITLDLDPTDYVTQLTDERNRIERIGAEGVDIGVAASFNLSYSRLEPESARVFRLLSVFPGTFDASAEEAVCADKDHVQLSNLVRWSLVLFDANTKRYRLHDLARLFAKSKLTVEELQDGQKRHATHYLDVLRAADELYLEGGDALALGLVLFDLEWSNITAGHAWIAEQDVTTDVNVAVLAMSYPVVSAHVLDLRQPPRERIRWLEFALAAAKQLKHQGGEGMVLNSLGLAHAVLGETERAIEIYEQVLANARDLGDRTAEGAALSNMGLAYSSSGQTELAIPVCEQALLIHRELGDRRAEGHTLGVLGTAYARTGDRQRAILSFEQALLIHRELGDRRGEAYDLWNLGVTLNQLGKRAEAIQYAKDSLTIFEQIEDHFVEGVRAALAEWRDESSGK